MSENNNGADEDSIHQDFINDKFSELVITQFNEMRNKNEFIDFYVKVKNRIDMIYPQRREKHLKIKFYDGNQVEEKIVWGLGEGF